MLVVLVDWGSANLTVQSLLSGKSLNFTTFFLLYYYWFYRGIFYNDF